MAFKQNIGGVLKENIGGFENIGGVQKQFLRAYQNIDGVLELLWEKTVIGTLDETSWADISKVAAAGQAANYWSVGDAKQIALNGTVGTLTLNNYDTWVYILGFDHNGATGTIDFGTFKTAASGGVDVCLIDGSYDSSKNDGTKLFSMNHWGSYNNGGWKRSDIRYDILGSTNVAPEGYGTSSSSGEAGYDATETCAINPVPNTLMAALPSNLRAVMKPMTIYTSIGGTNATDASKVTSSVDYLPLMAEFEIFGKRTYANSAEQNYQKQYTYYSSGNSKVKYQYSATNSAAAWWTRSPHLTSSNYFCYARDAGTIAMQSASFSSGLAPAFRV